MQALSIARALAAFDVALWPHSFLKVPDAGPSSLPCEHIQPHRHSPPHASGLVATEEALVKIHLGSPCLPAIATPESKAICLSVCLCIFKLLSSQYH